MSGANLEKVIEEVRALTPGEQREVRKILDLLLNGSAQLSPEDILDQRLLEAGVISEIPPRTVDSKRFQEWEPVKVEGNPLSEIIIEDRR